MYVDHLEGKAVMGDSGREILLIQKGLKRSFPDYETFLKMKFTDKHTKHITGNSLSFIEYYHLIESSPNDIYIYIYRINCYINNNIIFI